MSDIPALYPVPDAFAASAAIKRADYERLYAESVRDPDAFWAKVGERLHWERKPTQIRDVSFDLKDFRIRWYADGELNASVNCLDRHLEARGDKTALIWESDDPAAPAQHVTYRQLHQRVCKLGNALRNLGVKKGDIVRRGQKIGAVGSTGRSTGAHLHFEVLVQSVPQDPQKFLSAGGDVAAQQLAAQGTRASRAAQFEATSRDAKARAAQR